MQGGIGLYCIYRETGFSSVTVLEKEVIAYDYTREIRLLFPFINRIHVLKGCFASKTSNYTIPIREMIEILSNTFLQIHTIHK